MTSSLLAQLKAHKTDVMVGGAGVAVTVALYMKSRSKSTSTASSSAAPATAATVVTPGYTVSPGETIATTTGTDAYTGMETQILGLQQDLLGLKTTSLSTHSQATTGTWHTTPMKPSPAPSGSGAGASALQPTVTLTTQTLFGTGYSPGKGRNAGVVAGSTGGDWATISTWTATIADIGAGDTVGYESSLGGFTPITSVTQYKSLEHTQTGAQTTTYVKPKS